MSDQASLEKRIRNLEGMITFHQANNIALQTVLVAAVKTIARDPGTKAYFTVTLKAAAEGSFDHAIGTNWTDEMISISRRGMAAFVGKDIAADAGLP